MAVEQIVIPNPGLLDALADFIAGRLSNARIRLFTSNITPARGDTVSTYSSFEATFPGYAAITGATWGTPIMSGQLATSTSNLLIWTRSSSGSTETQYGIWANDNSSPSSGDLLFALAFGTPINITSAGDQVIRTLAMIYKSLYP